MMDEVVVSLVALNERTRRAWAHKHNERYYVGPSFKGFQERPGTSRQSTPSDHGYLEDDEAELRLSFNKRPKDITKGWMFGRDRNLCDLYCGETDDIDGYNIGRQTFFITISKQGNVILTNLREKIVMTVGYGIQKAGRRREFVWIMFSDCPGVVVTTANLLKFIVTVTKPCNQTTLYKTLQAQFLKDVEDSMPSIPLPSVANGITTANTSLVTTSNHCPFYYIRKDRLLGKGSFGKVYVVVDASTGVEYAGKKFFGGYDRSEPRILATQPHVSRITFFRFRYDLFFASGKYPIK